MKAGTALLIALAATLSGGCSVEPPAPADSPTEPPPARGSLRGSVLRADASAAGMSDVLIGFRSAHEYLIVNSNADGSFRVDGLPNIEWRAELQIPEDHFLAPGETGTRVALVQPDRVIALLPFRLVSARPDTLPPAPAPPAVP
jgi:hypothetical protein